MKAETFLIYYEESFIVTGRKRDFTGSEFVSCWHNYSLLALDSNEPPSEFVKYLKVGWERWCQGDHSWSGRDPNEGLWHLSFSKRSRAREVWVLDPKNELNQSWTGSCQ